MGSQGETSTLQCVLLVWKVQMPQVSLGNKYHIQIIHFFCPIEGKTLLKLSRMSEVSGSNLVQIWTIDWEPALNTLILFHLTLVFSVELFLIYLWSFHHIPQNPRLNFHWWGSRAVYVPSFQFQAYLFLKGLNFQKNFELWLLQSHSYITVINIHFSSFTNRLLIRIT